MSAVWRRDPPVRTRWPGLPLRRGLVTGGLWPADFDDAETWGFVRHLLACRSGHRCEVGGELLDAVNEGSVHHRQPRGMGGTSDPDVHSLERLLLVCGGRLAGVAGHHGQVEADREWAYRRGLLVPRAAPGVSTDATDCAKVPVVLWSGRRVLLDPVALEYRQAPGAPYAAA